MLPTFDNWQQIWATSQTIKHQNPLKGNRQFGSQRQIKINEWILQSVPTQYLLPTTQLSKRQLIDPLLDIALRLAP